MATFTITTAVNILHDTILQETMVVYKIECIITGKCYIGQCRGSVRKRWNAHKSYGSGAGKSAIKQAIKKYGYKNFKFSVIDYAQSIVELDLKEIKWIKELNTLAPNGYNLTEGGSKGKIISPESIEKMRQSAIKRFEREGRRVIPISNAEKDRRKLIRHEASRKRLIGNTYNLGKKRNLETISKIRLSKVGNQNRNTKVIRSDGIIFESIKDAAIAINAKPGSIVSVLSGRRKTIYSYTLSYYHNKGELLLPIL